MLKIGLFSKLSRVSIRMLRYYDEIGLLHPAYIDPESDYRYYREDQLPQIGWIKALRDMGFSLADVCRMTEIGHDAEKLAPYFETRRRELEACAAETAQQLLLLESARNRLGKGKRRFRRHGQHRFAASHQFLCFGKRLGLRTVRTFRLAAGQNRFFFLASKAKRIKGAQADDQHADRQYHIKALFFHHAVITLIGSFHPGLEFLPSPASFHLHPSRLKFALQPGFPFQSGYSSVPSSVPG